MLLIELSSPPLVTASAISGKAHKASIKVTIFLQWLGFSISFFLLPLLEGVEEENYEDY